MKLKSIGKTGAIPVLALLLLVGCVPTDEVVPVETKNETTATQAVEIQTWQPWADVPLNDDVQGYLHNMCEDNNLAYSFIIALIETESNFNSDSVSATDDYGLMQINACNHKEGFDYLDPYDNITMGIEMLADLSEKYGDVESVLMAYNLGEAGAKKLWNQGIYSTEYTKKVLKKKIEYEKEHLGFTDETVAKITEILNEAGEKIAPVLEECKERAESEEIKQKQTKTGKRKM